jgi:2,3-bisphosphoglycerate-independent phosphoglycerate mutase
MKYAIIIPDGAADEPLAELGGKTPLEAAQTPNMDRAGRVRERQRRRDDVFAGV